MRHARHMTSDLRPAPHGLVSIGVAGALGPESIARIAAATERAGFHALWVNDTPQGDSIDALRAAAETTESLTLATGVIPFDRRPAEAVADALRAAGLPEHRVVLGVGSGALSVGALALVREGVTTLRAQTRASIVVGALGPKMRELAARDAAGVLLNWVTPEVAAKQAATAREQAAPHPTRVIAYARTALDPDARARLDAEVDGYAAAPKYAANFGRLGIDPRHTVLPIEGESGILDRVRQYTAGVDELVLRAITASDDVEAYLDFIERAAAELAI